MSNRPSFLSTRMHHNRLSFKRAGANDILTYFAKHIAEKLKNK